MTAAFRPYISADIETTGLADEAEVLQIAGVIDDGVSPIDQLFTFDYKIKYKSFGYSEPFALKLNATLIEEMTNKETAGNFVTPQEAATGLINAMNNASEIAKVYDQANGVNMNGKVMFAGKNFASFDDPKIRNFLAKYTPSLLKEYNYLASYKTIDPGSMYYTDFGYNPSLSQINNLTGRQAVNHNALDDAFDVVYAIRYKANLL